MHLSVDIRHGFSTRSSATPAFNLDIGFTSTASAIALSGPSGSGKSTILNTIAGIVRPDAARIVLRDDILVDTTRSIFIPPWKRRIGYVFQDGRLLPHLTVHQNLLFGRWFSRNKNPSLDQGAIIDLLGIAPLLARRPSALSGGEKQRVAIGRALLAEPRLLLMDEPLASLDVERRQQIIPLIERIRDEIKIPIIYVSHDPAETQRIGKDIVAIADGRVASEQRTRTPHASDKNKVACLDTYRIRSRPIHSAASGT